MEFDIKTIIDEIILPIRNGWKLSELDVEKEKLEVHVYLHINRI